MDLTYNIYFCS